MCQYCSHIETSQLICTANQSTGFYLRTTLALNGLIKWHSIESKRLNCNDCILLQIGRYTGQQHPIFLKNLNSLRNQSFLIKKWGTLNSHYHSNFNSFMTEAVIMDWLDWFLYDNGLCHERVKGELYPKNFYKNS